MTNRPEPHELGFAVTGIILLFLAIHGIIWFFKFLASW